MNIKSYTPNLFKFDDGCILTWNTISISDQFIKTNIPKTKLEMEEYLKKIHNHLSENNDVYNEMDDNIAYFIESIDDFNKDIVQLVSYPMDDSLRYYFIEN